MKITREEFFNLILCCAAANFGRMLQGNIRYVGVVEPLRKYQDGDNVHHWKEKIGDVLVFNPTPNPLMTYDTTNTLLRENVLLSYIFIS